MSRSIKIDNYILNASVEDILNDLRLTLTNGKLRDVKVHNSDIVVTCPHHANGKEANPDCNIYIGDDTDIPYGFARCFACDFKGTFDVFVAECFDSSIAYAKQWLIKNYGEYAGDAIQIDSFIKLDKPKQIYLDDSFLDDYQSWTPYLQKRKLNRDICNKFKVKYDPKYRQVIFPVYDKYGHLLMAPKRSIDTKIFYLDSDREKPVYGLNVIEKNNVSRCMIVEGPIDMLTCWSNGVPAIATLGSPSIEQIEKINNSCINALYIAFDNDDAGRKFSRFVDAKLDKRILRTYVSLPPNRKDVNDLTEEEWQNLLIKYNL